MPSLLGQTERVTGNKSIVLMVSCVLSGIWNIVLLYGAGYSELRPEWLKYIFFPIFGIPMWYYFYEYSVKPGDRDFFIIAFGFFLLCPFIAFLFGIPIMRAYALVVQ
jgi:hypothetical protein